MPVPTAATSNALSKDSRVVFTNLPSSDLRVASVTATTITVDSSDLITGKSLYTSGTPGLLMVKSGVAANDNGLTANITGISGNVLTVSMDLSADVADGSIVAVFPPHSMQIETQGGHTLQVTAENEKTKGHTDTYLTHNTPHTVNIGGELPFYLPMTTQQVVRLLAWAFGGYKKSASNTHDIITLEDSDGTYTDLSRATIYSSEGNAFLEQIFGNMFAKSLTISITQDAPITASITTVGNVYGREVGGTGKTFPTGASNYVVSGLPCASGQRFTSVGAFAQFGGSFGGALGDTRETAVTGVTITLTRESDEPHVLGSQYVLNPEESGIDLTVSLTRIANDNARHNEFMGGKSDPSAPKTETRLLLTLVPTDPASTESISIDIPRGFTDGWTLDRPRGRFTETLTYVAAHTLTADECPDITVPLVRVRAVAAHDVDVGAALE